MKIKNKEQFDDYRAQLEALLPQITRYENEGDIPTEDLERFNHLSNAIHEWEAAYHPLPGKVSTLITDAVKTRMQEKHLKQKETAKLLEISESRMSDLLNGKRPLNLNLVKQLRDKLNIPANFILDNL